MFSKPGDKMWDAEYAKWVDGMHPDTMFGVKFDEVPRPLIQKLGLHITDRKFVKEIKTSDAEYYGLAPWVTDEMAEVALTMKVHKIYTFAQMQKMTGKEPKRLMELLEELAQVGVVEYKWPGGDGKGTVEDRMYSLPPFIVGSGEYMGMKKSMVEKTPEAIMLFDRMAFQPLSGLTQMVPPGGAGMAMHVIPVEQAIPAKAESVDSEHLSYWLKKYTTFAALPCVCRMSKEVLDEGDGEDPEDMCLAVGDMARYSVETGRGRYITYDEAMEIIYKAEEMGCVHQITNLDGPEHILGICNCGVGSCLALRSSQFFNTPNLSRSAYVAHVDKGNCVACGKCVEVCPASAVKLGQKLCTTEGEVCYPKQELPDETPWPKEKWNPNYRYDARTNCYDTGTAPCKTACPAHIAIQGYIKMAGEGRYREALELIKKDNPFPAVCGRVCNRRCEDACTRAGVDKAVAIDAIKKFIADQDLAAETRYVPEIHSAKRHGRFEGRRVAVIGAGPAGLSCAYFLAGMGYYPTVFEKNPLPGGMLRYGIPEYKLSRDVIDAEIDVLREMGVEIRCGVEIGRDVTIQALRDEGYESFCLAIGAQAGAKLGIPGEELAGVLSGVDFLHLAAEGKAPDIGRRVAVIGGGNVAMDVARTAKLLGAEEITVVYRRKESDMKAERQEIDEALAEGIVLKTEHKPLRIEGEGKVRALVCDAGEIVCDTVIAAIGQRVDLGGIAPEAMVIRENGTIDAAELTYQTAQKDIFAVGDVFSGPKYVIDAIAAGREAAISMHRFMRPKTSLTLNRNRRDFIELDKSKVAIPVSELKAPARAEGELTEELVRQEASRCLGCGAAVVDTNRCLGCGVCTTRCRFDAIHLSRDLPECSDLVDRFDSNKKLLPYMIKRGIKIKKKELAEKFKK